MKHALQALYDDIECDSAFDALRTTAHGLVPGAGSHDAHIVLIGEAPGKNEDEQGVPFVGASGRVLNELLTAAGLTRDDVYITNIVKYRPPDNRDPTKAEKQAALPYLMREIDAISPKLVMTLGRHSMTAFLPNAKISQVHGVLHNVTINDVQYCVIPLYHPAVALYGASKKQVLIDDFVHAISTHYTQV